MTPDLYSQPIKIQDPYNPYNLKKMPGESEADFQKRLNNVSMTLAEAEANKLADTQANQSRATLEEQKNIQKTRLQELATLLAEQENRKFNQAIPEIAETAQGQGFLETSGFGNSLARERAKLAGDTAYTLGLQGIADRDFEVGAIGDINKQKQGLEIAGVERKYSLQDLTRSEQLARELGRMGVPAPARQPSTFDKTLQYAGPILSGVGAVKGA